MADVSTAVVEFRHNTDITPGAAYVTSVPRVAPVFLNSAEFSRFAAFDNVANSTQRRSRRIGTISLLLAGFALCGVTAELLASAVGRHVPPAVTVAVEMAALVSIFLAVGPRFTQTRTTWLTARFITEQIRQWTFCLFLVRLC
jgi:hypothetical protein